MSELGSGSGSSYPGSIDTDDTQEVNAPNAGKTKARAEVPNDLASAIIAVQTELGTDPAGILTNVKTFLQTEHGTNGTHKTSLVVMIAGTQTITGTKTFDVSPIVPNSSISVNRNNVNQGSVVTATFTKVEFTTEDYDTNDDFDNSSNYRFTPTVAGKYLITAAATFISLAADKEVQISVYKNGSADKTVASSNAQVTNAAAEITVIIPMNGSTDYIEIFAQHNHGSDLSMSGDTERTWFMASRNSA